MRDDSSSTTTTTTGMVAGPHPLHGYYLLAEHKTEQCHQTHFLRDNPSPDLQLHLQRRASLPVIHTYHSHLDFADDYHHPYLRRNPDHYLPPHLPPPARPSLSQAEWPSHNLSTSSHEQPLSTSTTPSSASGSASPTLARGLQSHSPPTPKSATPVSTVPPPVKRRGKLPKNTTDLLKSWLHEHADHPYPSEDEKKSLCAATGLTLNQVSNWMINARRRILAPAKNLLAQSQMNHGMASPQTVSPPGYPQQHSHAHHPISPTGPQSYPPSGPRHFAGGSIYSPASPAPANPGYFPQAQHPSQPHSNYPSLPNLNMYAPASQSLPSSYQSPHAYHNTHRVEYPFAYHLPAGGSPINYHGTLASPSSGSSSAPGSSHGPPGSSGSNSGSGMLSRSLIDDGLVGRAMYTSHTHHPQSAEIYSSARSLPVNQGVPPTHQMPPLPLPLNLTLEKEPLGHAPLHQQVRRITPTPPLSSGTGASVEHVNGKFPTTRESLRVESPAGSDGGTPMPGHARIYGAPRDHSSQESQSNLTSSPPLMSSLNHSNPNRDAYGSGGIAVPNGSLPGALFGSGPGLASGLSAPSRGVSVGSGGESPRT